MNHDLTRLWLILLVLAATTPALAEPGTWRAMAKRDLRFIHHTLAAHHPGPLDDQNPEFGLWHEQGLKESLALLDQVKSYGGYRAVLLRYAAGFRDGHLNLDLYLDYQNVGWPGFMVAWREGHVRVQHVEEGREAPVYGSTLLQCDGTRAEELMAKRVFPFQGLGIPADMYELAPEIFINRFNPLMDGLKSCVFEQDGEQVNVELQWDWHPWSDIEDAWRSATPVSRGTFEMRQVAGDGVWISLPSFGPQGQDLEKMRSIMAALPGERDRDYIVLDVRGNGGGSSYWGEPFIRGLYGDSYYKAKDAAEEAGRDPHAVHRVSAENLKHFEDLLEYIKSQATEDSEFYRYFAALVNGMRQALADGQPMYAHRYEEDEPDSGQDARSSNGDTAANSLYDGTLFFLTDGFCASSCLEIADALLELPNLVHIGQPTSADTAYMEVRIVKLPSRNGGLTFATKVGRGRKRGHNAYYTPAHQWPGDIRDTPALEKWILGLRPAP